MVSREPVLLIVAADRRELAGIARLASSGVNPRAASGLETVDLSIEWSRIGRLGARIVVLAANGAGRTNAARAVRNASEKLAIAGVVSTGLCGGLAPALAPGAVVVADRVISLAPAAALGALRPRRAEQGARAVAGVANGPVLTVDYVVQSAEEKQRLRSTGAVAVEMEAAGVAAEAQKRGLPFFCIKVVSDAAEESFGIDYNRARRPDGRFSTARIAGQAGLSPAHWRELLGWRRRIAAGAEALGEFFRGAEFEG